MSTSIILTTIFWLAGFTIGYTYILFPIILIIRSRRMSVHPKRQVSDNVSFSVTMIIAVLNEEQTIIEKLNNTISQEYEQEKLQIIVAANGCQDKTEALVLAHPANNISLLSLPKRGKNTAINEAMKQATGEILVFSDADSIMTKDALKQLLSPFHDASVGATGGDYHHIGESKKGQGERSYWNLDRWLKKLQSKVGSMTSATGQLYAIRRELFKPVPSGVADDFFLSTQAPLQHMRLVFVPEAVVYGPVAAAKDEFRRKIRIVTRGLNSMWRQRRLLNPVNYGFYSLQLFSHKVLRWFMIVPLLLLLISNLWLAQQSPIYAILALLQTSFYLIGFIGLWLQSKTTGQRKLLSLPGFFIQVNIAAGLAVINFATRRYYDSWIANR